MKSSASSFQVTHASDCCFDSWLEAPHELLEEQMSEVKLVDRRGGWIPGAAGADIAEYGAGREQKLGGVLQVTVQPASRAARPAEPDQLPR